MKNLIYFQTRIPRHPKVDLIVVMFSSPPNECQHHCS